MRITNTVLVVAHIAVSSACPPGEGGSGVSRRWTPIFLLCARPAVAVREQLLSAQEGCVMASAGGQ
jgi:hypothetical protein